MDTAVDWGSGASSSQSCLGVLAVCFGSVVELQWDWRLKRMFWQPPATVGPSGVSACILQHGGSDGGTPERVPTRCPSIQKIVLKGTLNLQRCHLGRGAVLGLAPAECAGAAGEDSDSKDIFGTRFSISTEQLSWWWEE